MLKIKTPLCKRYQTVKDGWIRCRWVTSLYHIIDHMTILCVMSFRIPTPTKKHGVSLDSSDRPKVVKKLIFSKEFEVSCSKLIMLSALIVLCIEICETSVQKREKICMSRL